MSVTFMSVGAGVVSYRRPCSFPDLGVTCTAEERCGYCDDGFEWVNDYPTPPVNMSNFMARVVFDLLAIEGESEHGLVGSLAHNALPFFLKRCMAVLANEGLRAPYLGGVVKLRPTQVVKGEGGLPTLTPGPLVYMGGLSDERVVHAVEQVRDLFSTCARNGWGVSWS